MRITLNLATRPYVAQGPILKLLRIGMAVLAVLLIGLGLGLLHFHQRALAMAAQEAAVDRSIAKIQREQQGYQAQMQQSANAKVLTQAQFLNHLFDEKSFSWTACMEDLERVLPAGLQVTAIEPSRGKDGRLTLRLRVSGLRERSVDMVRNMERSRRFIAPRLSGENAENGSQGDLQAAQDTGRVSFDILAEYSQATLAERKAAIAAQKKAALVAATVPVRPQGRPQYIPPNPQRRMPMRPSNNMPGMPSPYVSPVPNPMPVPEPPAETQPNMPHNHEFNRNRPLNSTVPDPNNGGPQ